MMTKSSNKVLMNTIVLYVRMMLTIGITLYSTRIVLNALGSTDYGIFNLVAGVVVMLSFLNTAMATSTQRYLSFYQGQDNLSMQKNVFTNSLLLHMAIGVVVVFGLEVSSLYLFESVLNIPVERVHEAKMVYHFMSATVFFTIIAVPFSGLLIAHENMLWVAIVNIVETILKLLIAISLISIQSDKLVAFGLLTALISVVSFVLYSVFCFRKYEDCTVENLFVIDKSLLKDLTSFAGWNLFSSLCSIGRSQGLAVILNFFLGAIVNASYAIANQVASQLNFFSATMLRAINPQIMKSEGAEDRERMLRLSMIASKFGFYLLAFFAVPCIFEMSSILKLWLNDVPSQAVVFCQLMLVGSLINQLTVGLQSAVQAIGKIRVYQTVVGTLILLNLPLAYLLLKYNYPAYSVLVSFAVIELLACSLRLLFLRKIAGLSIKLYCRRVFSDELIPLFSIISVCYLTTSMLSMEFRFLITGMLSSVIFIITVYFFGLAYDEKRFVNQYLTRLRTIFQRVYFRE